MRLCSRRDIFKGLASGLSVGFLPELFAQSSNGQFKPTRPVKLISPLQAGGTTNDPTNATEPFVAPCPIFLLSLYV